MSGRRSICRTCVYGFPDGRGGYRCGITRKRPSAIVIRCTAHEDNCEERMRKGAVHGCE